MRRVLILGVVVASSLGVFFFLVPQVERGPEKTSAVTGPASDLVMGRELFERNCMACHGSGAQGSPAGPPLVHKYYEPSHHADAAFYIAVQRGVRQHHWKFGNMPPIPGVKKEEVAFIIAYVRDLQRKAGIY